MGTYPLEDHGDFGPHVNARAINERLAELGVDVSAVTALVSAAIDAAYAESRLLSHPFRCGECYRAADAVRLGALARAELEAATRKQSQFELFAGGAR